MKAQVKTGWDKDDLQFAHQQLATHTTWAKQIPMSVLDKAAQHSLCFMLKNEMGERIGFCRVISDFATFANLVDVFVVEHYRGLGLSRTLMDAVLSHPDLQGLRRFTLATTDAHGLYKKFGFTTLNAPHTFMERYDKEVYLRANQKEVFADA
jgi:N-acetylglutamate synthase-like GNAT family acetyltransferase